MKYQGISEEEAIMLLKTTTDNIWKIDREHKYIFVSPMVENLLGYEPNELLGKKCTIVIHKSKENRKLIQTAWKRDGPPIQLKKKDGNLIWTIVRAVEMPYGYIGTTRNITAVLEKMFSPRKSIIEKRFHQMENFTKLNKEIWKQKKEIIAHISGRIANEFNNILTIIWGNIDILQQENSFLRNEDNFHEIFSDIKRGVDRAKNLDNLLLEISSGKHELEKNEDFEDFFQRKIIEANL